MLLGKLLQGIDVSGWQPGTQWDRVAQAGEYAFGFAKADESTYYREDTFQGNRAGMHAAGFSLVGCYDFAQASSTPENEADFFAGDIGAFAPGEAGVLDAEVRGLTGDFCAAWAHRLAQKAPGPRILYCSLSYYSDTLGTPDRLIGPGLEFDALWIAAYYTPRFDAAGNLTNGPDDVPWSFWQYTDKLTIPGVQGTCDDSFYRYDLDSLRKLSRLAPVQTIPTPQEAGNMNRHLRTTMNNGTVEDWLWMGPSRIMSRITVGGVYDVLKVGNDCPSVDVNEETLTEFQNWAANARFTG